MASRVKSPFSERWFGVTFWPEGRWWSQGRRWSPSPEQPQECWLLPASPPSPPPHAVSVHSQKDSPDALLVEAEVGNQTEQQVIVNITGGGGPHLSHGWACRFQWAAGTEAGRRFESCSGRRLCLQLSDQTGWPPLRHLQFDLSTAPETHPRVCTCADIQTFFFIRFCF